MTDELIAVDERGHRCGETHPLATLSDVQVEQLRVWHEAYGFGYRRLVDCAFLVWGACVSRSTVRDIVTYRRRSVSAVRLKRAR